MLFLIGLYELLLPLAGRARGHWAGVAYNRRGRRVKLLKKGRRMSSC